MIGLQSLFVCGRITLNFHQPWAAKKKKNETQRERNIVQKENCKHDFSIFHFSHTACKVPEGRVASKLENITWQVSMGFKENKHH